jgi:shikimate kinase
MGAGKSTLGALLSKELGWPYIDNDKEITTNCGLTPAEVSALPVDALHELESRYLCDVIARPAPFIAGAAASVIDSEENRTLLEGTFSVYLRLPIEKIIERAGTVGVGRQALADNGDQILIDRFNRRDPLYLATAKLTVELSNSPERDAEIIKSALLS